jgi:L-ascorbate metabolism protein UlaG (beta-lactamase superfamily)
VSTRLTFWGAAGYEVVSPTHRFLIDPFLTGNPAAPVAPEAIERPDAILVSHAAPHHVGDTAAIARRPGAPALCGGDVVTVEVETVGSLTNPVIAGY